jgi:hypothetical protein
MLRFIQHFGKHRSCHLQVECVEVGRFGSREQAAGGEFGSQLATYCLPYTTLHIQPEDGNCDNCRNIG